MRRPWRATIATTTADIAATSSSRSRATSTSGPSRQRRQPDVMIGPDVRRVSDPRRLRRHERQAEKAAHPHDPWRRTQRRRWQSTPGRRRRLGGLFPDAGVSGLRHRPAPARQVAESARPAFRSHHAAIGAGPLGRHPRMATRRRSGRRRFLHTQWPGGTGQHHDPTSTSTMPTCCPASAARRSGRSSAHGGAARQDRPRDHRAAFAARSRHVAHRAISVRSW